MPSFVVTCPTCGNISDDVYRCDDPMCGADLASADSQVWKFQYPSVAGTRDDGLVAIEIPIECVSCETTRWLPLEYQMIGRVIRMGCAKCSQVTRHRPTGPDTRRGANIIDTDGGIDVSTDDQQAASSTS